MKILALELSSGRGSIACCEGETELFAEEFANDRKHSGAFFQNLEQCLLGCGQPERIIVGLGPGSYAGTRIALATAIGLQAVSGAELCGASSVRAFPSPAGEYAVIGDARRASFFFAQVQGNRCVTGPDLLDGNELEARLQGVPFPIYATEMLARFPTVAVMHPCARTLAKISTELTHPPLQPIYLREPHITQPRLLPK